MWVLGTKFDMLKKVESLAVSISSNQDHFQLLKAISSAASPNSVMDNHSLFDVRHLLQG